MTSTKNPIFDTPVHMSRTPLWTSRVIVELVPTVQVNNSLAHTSTTPKAQQRLLLCLAFFPLLLLGEGIIGKVKKRNQQQTDRPLLLLAQHISCMPRCH